MGLKPIKYPSILVILLIAFGAGSPANAGGRDTGGGSACLSLFMSLANETAEWLNRNRITPSLSGQEFMSAIDANKILQTDEDLRVNSQPVDALYDGEFIKVNCTRLMIEYSMPEGRQRVQMVVAHEIFRSMSARPDLVARRIFEGDRYEMSRQIFRTSNVRQAPATSVRSTPVQRRCPGCPPDQSGLSEIGRGAKLRLLKTLRFGAGAHNDEILGNRRPTTSINALGNPEVISCNVEVDRPSDAVRSVPTNTIYEIESIGPGEGSGPRNNHIDMCSYDAYTKVTFRNSGLTLTCHRFVDSNYPICLGATELTIQEFRRLIGDYFSIQSVQQEGFR